MRERLRKRLPEAKDAEIDVLAGIVEDYNLTLTVKNLDASGLILFDQKGRSVRVSFGEWRSRTVHIPAPESDITIAVVSGIISGWIESDKLEYLEDRCIVDLKILNPMPDEFVFDQYCSHLVDHGGFWEGDFWECAGCGKSLVFNDNK